MMQQPQKGFRFDLNRCTGCHACQLACAIENEIAAGSWRQVVTFNEFRHPGAPVFHLSLACNHCRDAPCMKHCPALAYAKDPSTGAVNVDPERCIGCRYCSWACPFDAPRYDARAGVVTKCTFCDHRRAEGLEPACVALCPTGALGFGDAETSPGVDRVPGFPATEFGPAIRFVPLQERRRLPELDGTIELGEMPGLRPSSKVTLRSEWPLVGFTLIAAALVAVLTASVFGSLRLHPVAFLGVAIFSLVLSTLHLGWKRRAWRALLNLRGSWLSREILLIAGFVGLVAAQWLFAPGGAWLLRLAVPVGFAALYAVDRVYDVVTWEKSFRVHSADVLLTGLLLTGILLGNLPIAAFFALVKLFLYPVGKVGFMRRRRSPRPCRSLLRVGSGFLFPLVMGLADPARWPVWALAGTAIGEFVDRCEFYLELEVTTPRRQMALELEGMLPIRRREPARGRPILTLSVLAIAISMMPAGAAELYVSPSGSDADSGLTADDAFRTIQHAADLAGAGDTVHVLPGTYVEEVGVYTSGAAGSPITFLAAGGGPVILDGQHRGCPQGQRPDPEALEFGFVGWDAHRIAIDGFEVKRFCFGGILFENSSWVEIRNCRIHENGVTLPEPGPGESLEGQGIYVEGNHFVIENNVVTDNVPRNADSGSGIVAWGADTVTVRNNVSERNNGNGILIEDCTNVLVEGNVVRSNVGDFGDWGTGGIWLDGGHTVTVRNNWFEDNVWSGLEITDETPSDPYGYEIYNNVAVGNWYGLWLDGIGRSGRTRNLIYNNTFVDNIRLGVWVSWEGIAGGSATQLKRTRFYNNLVAQPAVDKPALEVEAGSWDDVVFDHNLYYRQGSGSAIRWAGADRTFSEYRSRSGWDGAGMAADPRLRSPAEQDFHLLAPSPAIDAGTSTYPVPATDYEGHERLVAAAVDIGAFEYENVVAACTADATTLCLNQDRFGVQVAWRDFQGHTGTGRAVPLTGDTGYFWFFDSANVELVVKVLDGRALNDHFWVFYGSLSNAEYTMTVTDTETGAVKSYTNPSGQFASVGDTTAF
ncbi:MAG: dimethyl sulfoxide reductase anchor subunit [bacterium]|nr:dimethyl sulfoxide reductase anchor subunit [bacterium]